MAGEPRVAEAVEQQHRPPVGVADLFVADPAGPVLEHHGAPSVLEYRSGASVWTAGAVPCKRADADHDRRVRAGAAGDGAAATGPAGAGTRGDDRLAALRD